MLTRREFGFGAGATAFALSQYATANAATTIVLNAGTTGPGSLAYVWVSSIATVFGQLSQPISLNVTAGIYDVEALRLMDTGVPAVDVSFVSGSSLILAAQGKAPFKSPLDNIRALSPLGYAPVVIVAREDTGITTLDQVAGKRISAGPAGSGNDIFARAFFKFKYPDANFSFVPMDYSAFAGAIQDRKIDVLFTIGLPPYPALVEASALAKLNFIPLVAEQVADWLEVSPQHHPMELPANSYPSQESPVPTIGHVSHFVASTHLSDDLGYQITKQWLDPAVRDALVTMTPSIKAGYEVLESGLFFDDLIGGGAKLHAGAVKAMREHGITVPDAVVA